MTKIRKNSDTDKILTTVDGKIKMLIISKLDFTISNNNLISQLVLVPKVFC